MSKSMAKIDRDELLRRVTHFEITLDEADAEAARCGLEPLNPDPDPTVFDPMSEVRWSLPMTLAWIIWRDPDRVRWQWDRWRREKLVWAELMLPGRDAIEYHLVPLKRNFGSWSDVVLDTSVREAFGHVPVVAPDAAKSELWKLFQEGKLDPDGINAETDRREPINARQFQDLVIVTGGDKTPDLLSAGWGRILYHDVSVSREELLKRKHFPAVVAALGKPSSTEKRRGRPGYSPEVWAPGKKLLLEKLDEFGEPHTACSDPNWRNKEHAVKLVQMSASEYIQRHRGDADAEVGRSTAQQMVDIWLKEYRAGQPEIPE